jgi:hypothetical protein
MMYAKLAHLHACAIGARLDIRYRNPTVHGQDH